MPAASNTDVSGLCRTNCSQAQAAAVDLVSPLLAVFRGSLAHLPELLLGRVPHGPAHFLKVFSHFFRLFSQPFTRGRHVVPFHKNVGNPSQFLSWPLGLSCFAAAGGPAGALPRGGGAARSTWVVAAVPGPSAAAALAAAGSRCVAAAGCGPLRRSNRPRLGFDFEIRLGRLVHLRRSMVLAKFSGRASPQSEICGSFTLAGTNSLDGVSSGAAAALVSSFCRSSRNR